MSQHTSQPKDLEKGDAGDHLDDARDPEVPEPIPGDSSAPIFSMYSEAIEQGDNKFAETLQKDCDEILIFTGLFSASIAALLTVTVQDLKPNSQDISAFYLGNIYGVLAGPNVTQASFSSHVSKPPPFSPPRYAIWVNSLWILSFVFSLICASTAMVVQHWVRRYIVLTQPAWCSPEKRARIRAMCFDYLSNALTLPCAIIDSLPILLHISLFLFFAGLGVFLFNINHAVFWSGSILGFIYLLVCFIALWTNFPTILLLPGGTLILKVVSGYQLSKWSSFYDCEILRWLIQDLGNDEALEKFFESIPGFFNSNLVKLRDGDFPKDLLGRLPPTLGPKPLLAMCWSALNGFLGRTLSSNSVDESVKSRRLEVGMNAMNVLYSSCLSSIPCDIFIEGRGQMLQLADSVIVRGQLLTYCKSEHEHTAHYARCMVAKILASAPAGPERDDSWIQFATSAFVLPDLQDYIDHGSDSLSLAILIHLIRQSNLLRFCDRDALKAFSKLDIRETLPGLQHEFCEVWNEIVKAKNGESKIPVKILREIRHLYISLHRDTDAAPTAFSASTPSFIPNPSYPPPGMPNPKLLRPSSYRLCDIASHRPDSTTRLQTTNSRVSTQPSDSSDATPHHSTSGGNTLLRQDKEAAIISGSPFPFDPTTPGKIGDGSHASAAALPSLPVYISPRPTDASPPGVVAAALQYISQTATLSRPLEATLSVSSTPTLAPEPAPTPLTPSDAGAAPAPTSIPPALSVIGIPVSPPPSRVPLLPSTELLSLPSDTTSPGPTGIAPPPRLRVRGLVNASRMCFSTAVLQLLVHTPPFWNLFSELGDLKGQRGEWGPEIGGGATPLVDATMRFFNEFVFQEPPQQAASGNLRKHDKAKKDHNDADSFEPTYMYDAMKEKRQLRNLLSGQQRDAEEFFRVYLDALDEELLSLLSSISTHKPASPVPEVGEREVSQSGRTEVGKRCLTASFVQSPITSIFGGKSCLRVRAPNQPDAAPLEGWRSLQLDIRPDSVHTIQDALAHLSQPQPVQVGQPSSSEASQQLLLETLPHVLVFHLERFPYDAAGDGANKISKHVQFAPELEIPPGMMAPAAGISAVPLHYKLYGVLYHHGESAGSGHYTVDVLHRDGESGGEGGWLHIDDEAVSAVQDEEMFGPWGVENERGDNRCAYMLFYCRTASTQA